ncbi:uncharacterized protein FA14DRAFT_183775 [Meira miltonrushii]|uniref:Uncharacterized protein n=1 Tax=Meira miltonrushii TaxID=1280837 RepID=A0A316VS17_9BASI|nr:uncharacterized protein FA14DRAFT_183775 [Meira miltonrushii]PWN38295.1 hypothetical protein FA14DRAFT_183775 [Meira miltonrushii]
MMMKNFSLTKVSLLFALFAEVILASAVNKRAPVSGSMNNVIISSMNNPPSDAQGFLKQGSFYGGARSSMEADGVIQQAMGWGMAFTTVQMPLNTVKAAEYVPGSPASFTETWQGGAYDMALTCHKYGQSIVDDLNAKCKNCGKTYTLAIVWGIFSGMNFDKDAIFSGGCSALEVTNSDSCFNNFPSGCSIRAVGESVELWNEKTTHISVNARSRSQIIAAIKKYAADKHLSVALPPA